MQQPTPEFWVLFLIMRLVTPLNAEKGRQEKSIKFETHYLAAKRKKEEVVSCKIAGFQLF
jgi:hypothetical protein